MIPTAGSEWPLRVTGDHRWLAAIARGWDHRTWRDPVGAYHAFQDDVRTAAWLFSLVRAARPALVVETGVHRGKSAVAILAGLRANRFGRLVSIDLPHRDPYLNGDGRRESCTVPEGKTGILVPRSWRDRWELRLGDARDLLPEAVAGGVDMFLHDSEHSVAQMSFEYETAWAAMRTGGVLATDDADWTMAWPQFLWDHHGTWVRLPMGPGFHRAVRRVA